MLLVYWNAIKSLQHNRKLVLPSWYLASLAHLRLLSESLYLFNVEECHNIPAKRSTLPALQRDRQIPATASALKPSTKWQQQHFVRQVNV